MTRGEWKAAFPGEPCWGAHYATLSNSLDPELLFDHDEDRQRAERLLAQQKEPTP